MFGNKKETVTKEVSVNLVIRSINNELNNKIRTKITSGKYIKQRKQVINDVHTTKANPYGFAFIFSKNRITSSFLLVQS